MFCPKCNGGTFIVEEDVIKVLETTTPIKLVLKTTYMCRSCNEKFSRVGVEDIEAKRQQPQTQGYQTSPETLRPGMSTTGQYQQGSSYQASEPAEKLRFLDNI
jgi:hypothetical protein